MEQSQKWKIMENVAGRESRPWRSRMVPENCQLAAMVVLTLSPPFPGSKLPSWILKPYHLLHCQLKLCLDVKVIVIMLIRCWANDILFQYNFSFPYKHVLYRPTLSLSEENPIKESFNAATKPYNTVDHLIGVHGPSWMQRLQKLCPGASLDYNIA